MASAGTSSRSPDARERLLLIAAAGLAIVFLLPALHTPFRFDDTFNYELRTGLLAAEGRDFWAYLDGGLDQMIDKGRLQPAGLALSTVPWVFSDAPTLYKLYLVLTAVLAMLIAMRVVRRLGIPLGVIALAVVLFAAFTQFRWYHDSILGYAGLAQWTVILLSTAILAWLRHAEGGGRRWLVAALGAWLVTMLLYEANVALLLVIAAAMTARRQGAHRALRDLTPFVAVTVLMIAAQGFMRSQPDAVTGAYGVHFSIADVLSTFWVTIVGAVPASYALFDPHGLMGDFTAPELAAGLWRGLAAGAAVALVAWRMSDPPASEIPKSAALGTALVGTALLIAPSSTLALALKYQGELRTGSAYLPVTIQVMGVAILVSLGAVLAARRASSPRARVAVLAPITAIVAVAAGVAGTANLRVVANEQDVLASRALLNDSLRHGVLDRAPDGATVVALRRDLNWYPSNVLLVPEAFSGIAYDRTGRKLNMRGDGPPPARRRCRPSPPSEWPKTPCTRPGDHGGWLAVRPVRDGGVATYAAAPSGRVADTEASATELVVYQQGAAAGTATPELVGLLPGGIPWSTPADMRWTVLRRGEGWVLRRGIFPARAARPLGASIDVDAPAPDFVHPRPVPDRIRILGTQRLLP